MVTQPDKHILNKLISYLDVIDSEHVNPEVSQKIQEIIINTEVTQRNHLFNELSENQLAQFYVVIKEIDVEREFLEHFLYYFYVNTSMDDKQFSKLINDYTEYRFIL